MKLNFLLLFTILFCVISCFKKNETSSKKILKVALTSEIPHMDPAVAFDSVSYEVIFQVHESLYQYDYLKRPYQLKPLLAKRMPIISKDGLNYTINLKKNIYYHSSADLPKERTVRANDIINQIKRVALKSTRSNGWWLFDGKIKGLNEFRNIAKSDLSNFEQPVEGLKALDEHTLRITLTNPSPQFIYSLAMPFTTPIPLEIIKKYKNDLSAGSIGTGPFYIKKWERGLSMELAKFDRFHTEHYPSQGDSISKEMNLLVDANKKLPLLDGIKFNVMKEGQTRWLNFLNKKIDIMPLSKEHYQLALNEKNKLKEELTQKKISLQIAPTLTFWWISFNMKDKVLGGKKNLLVRKAIAHAVDIDEYIKTFTNNLSLKANSVFPPGITGYNPAAKLPYSYNIEKAKSILAEAGYPNGKGLPVLTYDVRGNSTVARQMGEFVVQQLGKIGIKVKVIINSFPGFLNKAKTGQLQFWQGGWVMDYPDAENVVQLFYAKNHAPGPNTSYYSNEKLDEIYQQIAKTSPGEDYRSKLQKVEDIVHNDLPWIMLFYSRNYILNHNYVRNYRQSDLITNRYKYMDIK